MLDPRTEIKARLPIDELVSQYCQLNRKGRNFICLCPFHHDTHPSLLVSPDKGIAYCFACQTGGDIFSFYMAVENVDFPQALKDLAEKTAVELPKDRGVIAGPKKDEKDRMRECLEKALEFYRSSLENHALAKSYLEQRMITEELKKTFEIGYAPDSFDATYTYLLKSGFSRTEILGAGLGIQKEISEERIYDRFRHRIIFPIRDHHGNLIGFGGRTIGTDDAKYINSPEGPLYNKSSALFGFSLAKEAIRLSKSVILVEGYFDVIACHRVGRENVVAVSGTALTSQHVALLKRFADRVILSLDSDAAGEQAAERSFMLCKAEDLDVRKAEIPHGKDPDECAAKSPEILRSVLESEGIPYFDSVIEKLQSGSLSSRDMLQKLLPLMGAIVSAVEREECITKAASLLMTTVTALKDDLARATQSISQGGSTSDAPVTARSGDGHSPISATELLYGLLLTYPRHLSVMSQLLEPAETDLQSFHAEIRKISHMEFTPNPKQRTSDLLDESIRERASILELYCEEHFGTWSESLALKEIRKLCQKVNQVQLMKKQKELIESIRAARTEGKKVEEGQLLTQYQQVLKLTSLK